MIMSAVGTAPEDAESRETEIEHALQGNVCRCGTYRRIVGAVRQRRRERQVNR